jgi:hypothetical protein
MRVRSWLLGGVIAAVTLSGCGGGGHKAASNSGEPRPAPNGPPLTSAQVPPALRNHVLVAGDFPGFAPQESSVSNSPPEAASGMTERPGPERERDVARLKRLGFIASVRERLAPTGGAGTDEAISVAQQFPSTTASLSELAAETKPITAHERYTPFAVTGIPGARGFGGSSNGFTGINVAFADGTYFYLIGAGWRNGLSSPPTKAALIAAGQRLYHRVHH